MASNVPADLESLIEEVSSFTSNRLCRRCFMNGKPCSYQRKFEEEENSRKNIKGKIPKAFVAMPFRPVLNQIYSTQLKPHLEECCLDVERADDVNVTGFVICEKICRQIQRSQLVAAELTFDNANVFYELGLAYALNKNIVIFVQEQTKDQRRDLLTRIGISDNKCSFYFPFADLRPSETRIWHVASKTEHNIIQSQSDSVGIDKVVILLGDISTIKEDCKVNQGEDTKYEYTINKICGGAIHKAISNIEDKFREESSDGRDFVAPFQRITIEVSPDRSNNQQYRGAIRSGRDVTNISPSASEIENYIREARFVIICACPEEPASYFWMGFAHGLEKDVIPITIDKGKDTEGNSSPLPFDVRALWHISVSNNTISNLQKEIEIIYEILLMRGKDIEQRRKFWAPITDRGSVSIFVGSVEYTQANKRHVVGEWDYRTVSEIVSHLNQDKETLETVIQTPIIQLSERFIKNNALKAQETKRLGSILTDSNNNRNAIIVGSSDVNDMTDFALSKYANVPPFSPEVRQKKGFSGLIAYKSKGNCACGVGYSTHQTQSTFFEWYDNKDEKQVRGFYDLKNGGVLKENVNSDYVSTIANSPNGYECMYSHLAKFRLGEQYLIIIQGVSGPATFGLSQILTGSRLSQFSVFSDNDENKTAIILEKLRTIAQTDNDDYLSKCLDKYPNSIPKVGKYSEYMIGQLNKVWFAKQDDSCRSVEALVRVYVIDLPRNVQENEEAWHDERKILWYNYAMPPREIHRYI